MTVALTINGSTYNYPENQDENWGTVATQWATAVTNGMLQKAGGNFTLLADVNFGATYGLVSGYFKSRSSNISTTGVLRLANSDLIAFRNFANSADVSLGVDSSDRLTWNSSVVRTVATLIVNADVDAAAAIAYSKLNLATSIVNGDISVSAAIDRSKLASGTADHVVINSGAGAFSSEAQLAITRGGTGQSTATAAFDALAPTTTKGDVIVHNGTDNIRFAAGSDGAFLFAKSSTASGLEWESTSNLYWDDSNNRLGLSETVPLTTLHVKKSGVAPILAESVTSGASSAELASARVLHSSTGGMSDGHGTAILMSIEDDVSGVSDIAKVSAYRSGSDSSGALGFSTANAGSPTEKVTILPSGNVGIGTTNPVSKLTINSNTTAPSTSYVNSSEFLLRAADDSAAAISLQAFRSGSGTAGGLFTLHGRGTATSPSATLTNDEMFSILNRGTDNTGAASGTRASIRTYAHSDWTTTSQATGIRFSTTQDTTLVETERLRITHNGNIGIGTSTPTSKLSVNLNSSGTVPTPVLPGAAVFAEDATSSAITLVSAGSTPSIVGQRAGNTLASPSSVVTNNFLLSLTGYGYESVGGAYEEGARISLYATENWSTTARGTAMNFYLTAPTTTTLNSLATLTGSGGFRLNQVAGLADAATLRLQEKDTTPSAPTSGTEIKIYMKSDKLVVQYNDAGTVRYRYMELTGTTNPSTWVNTTTAP